MRIRPDCHVFHGADFHGVRIDIRCHFVEESDQILTVGGEKQVVTRAD